MTIDEASYAMCMLDDLCGLQSYSVSSDSYQHSTVVVKPRPEHFIDGDYAALYTIEEVIDFVKKEVKAL